MLFGGTFLLLLERHLLVNLIKGCCKEHWIQTIDAARTLIFVPMKKNNCFDLSFLAFCIICWSWTPAQMLSFALMHKLCVFNGSNIRFIHTLNSFVSASKHYICMLQCRSPRKCQKGDARNVLLPPIKLQTGLQGITSLWHTLNCVLVNGLCWKKTLAQ